jgi:hypothetical protein
MARAKREVKAWSKEDVKDLRAFAKDRLSGTQAAKKLRRTRGAVAQKAMKLGIRFGRFAENVVKCNGLQFYGGALTTNGRLSLPATRWPLRTRNMRHRSSLADSWQMPIIWAPDDARKDAQGHGRDQRKESERSRQASQEKVISPSSDFISR